MERSFGQLPPPVQYLVTQIPSRATNGLAIASMVLGILWLYWVGSILAVIFGAIAFRQIRERNEVGHGMAVAGFVLGLVGMCTLGLVLILVVVAHR
jgi:VIT1/CCC1 family predicted Fe2+/Mn2+ transporter